MKKFIAVLSAASVLGLAALPASSQPAAYPDKPIRLITPYPPGGGTDAVARIVGERLAAQMGQPVVIDNKAGANGSLGTELAAHAPADGYTLVLGSTATHSVNPSLYSKPGYDAIADFAPIAPVASTPIVLMVNPALPVHSVAELIALARSRPAGDSLTFASAGAGSAQHLGGELFKTLTGVDLLHVPYKGAGPAMADVLAGHVNMVFDTMPSAMPQIRGNKLRPIGISSPRRHPSLPDLPTIGETVPGYDFVSWYGLFAPAGTPPAIVERLNAELRKALATPEVSEKFKAAGIDVSWSSSADFALLVKTELPKWRKVIQQSGAKVD